MSSHISSCLHFCCTPLRDTVCNILLQKLGYLIYLIKNVSKLEREMEDLNASRLVVMTKVQNMEHNEPRKRTNRVVLWMDGVPLLSEKLTAIQTEYQSRRTCLCGCYTQISSSYKLGKRVAKLLEDDQELKKTRAEFSDEGMTEELISPSKDVWWLRMEMDELITARDGVLIKVSKLEEMPGQERTSQVVSWLETVRSLEEGFGSFNVVLDSACTCVDGCYHNCSLSSEFGKRAAMLLEEVRGANAERSGLTKLVEAIPGPSSSDADCPLEAALNDLRRLCFETDKASVIGVCGMGGIGKTTLLEKFKAELLHRPCDFKNIIFTVVSKEPNTQKIQRDVGKALGLSISESESTDDLALKIHEALHDKKFVLMLDDVWDGFTLKKTHKLIGVPFQNEGSKCKLILTTRTEMVCNQMGVGKHKVRVSLLGVEEAWELFKTNVGEMIINSNPGIEIHAKVMAKKCGGLPLALTIIGSAMASKTTIQEWEHAASAMEELRTGKIEGMEDELLSHLKLSYDSLPNGIIKECFLYCCLYPKDHDIDKEELVDYWVGEGFFQNEYGNDLDKARKEGHSIIGKLKNAHLLDTGLDSDSNVRMHDVIRDMAIWIANKYKKYRFLVHAGMGLSEAPDPREWRGTRRISLMHNVIKDLPSTIPDSSSLSTLLLQGNFHLSQISNGFFQSMTNLRVLDMLPKELGRLTRLRHLYLNNTFHVRSIPKNSISVLSKLQMLSLQNTRYRLGDGSTNNENSLGDAEVSLQDLGALKRLKDLRFDLKSIDDYHRFLNFKKLRTITIKLKLKDCHGLGTIDLSSNSWKMNHLRELTIENCYWLKELTVSGGEHGPALPKLESLNLRVLTLKRIKVGSHAALHNLCHLVIIACDELTHIRWIRHLRCLEDIHISYCHMKHLIDGDDETPPSLPRLKSIVLFELRILESICKHSLPFPSLQYLRGDRCHSLKKLPLEISSAPYLKEIKGSQNWWDGMGCSGMMKGYNKILLDVFGQLIKLADMKDPMFTMTTSVNKEHEVKNLATQLSPNVNKIYHLSGTQKFEFPEHEV